MLDQPRPPPRPRRPTRDLPALPTLDTTGAPPPHSSDAHTHTIPIASSPVDTLTSAAAASPPEADPGSRGGAGAGAPAADDRPHPGAPPAAGSAPASAHDGSSPRTHAPADTELSALRAHYLKKALIELEFEHEIDALLGAGAGSVSPLSYLGPPFSPPPRDAPALALPFLRYVFRQFVVSFPFLAAAPKNFFPDKLQPFVASVAARNLAPASVMDGADPVAGDAATRVKLQHKVQRNLALFVGAATRLAEREEVVRLSQADLDRLEALARRRREREARRGGVFEVNVVCVRTVVERGRVRSKAHDEFILRTRRSGQPDVFVARRYGDFKTLANELHKAYPDAVIPKPPTKDRSGVDVLSNPGSPISPGPSRLPTSSSLGSTLSTDSLQLPPGSPTGARGASPGLGGTRLAREKNRLTLRAYLHALMASATLAGSPQLRSFLTAGPTRLSADEELDARRREEADALRDEGRKRFAREIALRVEGLRGALRSVKGEAMGKDGLTHIFGIIKTTENVRNLPREYEAVLEWARISLASTIFQHLVASDNASETMASLKRIHGMMPYFMLKTALKVSNPIGMMRSVIDLFMAQPFGTQSLLQRMFTSSLHEEVKELEAEIAAVEDAVDDPMMCEKVKIFINAPKEIQSIYRADAEEANIHILAAVLRSPDAPALSRAQMHRVIRSHRAHAAYLKHREKLHDSDDDEGPEDEDAWLFEDLTVLAKLYSRLRDRQQIIELVFEGTTAELLKDIITIFYAPLAQVYKAASIADSIGDLQNFVNDLIRTVEQVDEATQSDPQRTVKIFVDLVQRHEQAFYSFVHKVHSKGEGLFNGLMRWIELFLTVVREGILPEPISLEFLLPYGGQERIQILKEVDDIALYHYKLKVAYEEKLRRRFGHAQENRSEADAEDEAAQALVNSVVEELSFGELMQGTALDVAAADTDESSSDDDDESGSETDSDSDYTTGSESDDHQTPTGTIARSGTVGRRSLSQKPASQGKNGVRPTRSMNSLHSRKNTERDLPPVPPLPPSLTTPVSPYNNKPLPPSPAKGRPSLEQRHSPPSRTSHDSRREPPSRTSHDGRQPPSRSSQESRREPPLRTSLQSYRRRPQSKPAKKRPRQDEIKPPTLHHIPNLLPIFVEMMRPGLEPRQVS